MSLQYIGARYVPRFMGAYDNTQVYEALDVVDNGQGTSYIAKIPVPAGTPLTNTTYWAIYGASSGAIINLQNQIGDITDLDTTDKDNLVDAINENVSRLQALSDISSRKIMLIMDSYGSRTNASSKNVAEIVADTTGAVCDRIYQSGAAVKNGTFSSLVTGYTGDGTIYDTVMLIGGANDQIGNESDIASGFVTLMNNIRTKFPNAVRIYVFCCGLTFDETNATNTRMRLAKRYEAGARNNGAVYIDNSQYVMCDTRLLDPDMCHPNADGVDTIAKYVAEALKKEVVNVHTEITPDSTLTEHFTTPGGTNVAFSMVRNNGSVTCCMGGASGRLTTISAATTYDGSGWIDLGEFTNSLIQEYGSLAGYNISTIGCVLDSNNNEKIVDVSLTISNKHMKAYINGAHGSLSNATALRVYGTLSWCD